MSDGVSSSVSRPVQTTEHPLAKSALKPRTPAGAVKPEEVGGKQIPKQTSDATMLPGLEKLVTIRQNIERNIKEIHTADDTLQGLSSRIDGLSKKTQKSEITQLKAQQEKEMQKIETAKITVQTLRSMEETQLREQASQLEVTATVVALDPKILLQTNKELTNVEKQIKNCEEQENKVQGKIDKLLKSLSTDDRKQLDTKVGADKSAFLKQKGFSDKQLDEYKALRDDKKQLNEKKQFLQRQKSDLEKQIKLADPKRGEILKREIVSAFASFEIVEGSSRSQELTQTINENLTNTSLGNVASDIFRDAPKVSIVRDGKQQKSAASAGQMPDPQAHMKEILTQLSIEGGGTGSSIVSPDTKLLSNDSARKHFDTASVSDADKKRMLTFTQALYSNLIGKELTRELGLEADRQIFMAVEMKADQIVRTCHPDGSVDMSYTLPITIKDKLATGQPDIATGVIELRIQYDSNMQAQGVRVHVQSFEALKNK